MTLRKKLELSTLIAVLIVMAVFFLSIGFMVWLRTWYVGYRRFDSLVAVALVVLYSIFLFIPLARFARVLRAAKRDAWLRMANRYPHQPSDPEQRMFFVKITLADREGPDIGSPGPNRSGRYWPIRVNVGESFLHLSPFLESGLPIGFSYDEVQFWSKAPQISIPFFGLSVDSCPPSQTLEPRRPWFTAKARPGHLELTSSDAELRIKLLNAELADLIQSRLRA